MHWIDWSIVAASLVITAWIGWLTQRYVKGVADFLSAGRVAGRYVLCVSGAEAGMGLISLVAIFESMYASGYAYGFWSSISAPIGIVMGLMGYCVYRFRETRAMTMGQFLEIRYSRKFRIFAGTLQAISGIVNYALFPAVGARFLVYFCGLPTEIVFCGMVFPTFVLLMAGFLAIAVILATMGGQLTIMTTDCIQGLLSYPMYVTVVAYFMWRFSWSQDLAPALLDRSPGKSLLNPYDIAQLRDFNLFYVIVGIVSGLLNRMSWCGNQGYTCAAKNAHEQKISAVLGTWRAGFSTMMFILLAVVGFAYLNTDKYQEGPRGAAACRTELAVKAVDDVLTGEHLGPVRQKVKAYLQTGTVTPELQAMLDKTAAIKASEEAARKKLQSVSQSQAAPAETAAKPAAATPTHTDAEERQLAREARMRTARDAIRSVEPGASQTFETIFGQMRVPLALRYLLPMGLMGIFCAICVMLMISTDISYQHSWGSILIQDIVLPLRGKPFSPHQHLFLLRCAIVFVATFSFFFSWFFGQVDYILMFFIITGAIWLGGAGPCIVGGLYWKRSTTAGAWTALIVGSGLAVTAALVQKFWVSDVYPWLVDKQLVDTVAWALETVSRPFEPLIEWRMSADKFPINSMELYGINMALSLGLYVVVSLLTCREPFNMDRMLHRGKYHREGDKHDELATTWRTILPKLLGIDKQYTRGDKILAWSVFIWSFGVCFLVYFVGVALWNLISPWSNQAWATWFFIWNFVVAGIVGLVSTVWFTIGGTIDLRRLFRDLAQKEVNVLDDGRVVGHISADDVELVEKVEHVTIEEAHVEEDILRKRLEKEHDQQDLDNLKKHLPEDRPPDHPKPN